MPTVGEQIKLARVYRGLKQGELGRLISPVQSVKGKSVNLGQPDISNLESGREPITPEIYEKLEAVLKVPFDDPAWGGFFAMFNQNGPTNDPA